MSSPVALQDPVTSLFVLGRDAQFIIDAVALALAVAHYVDEIITPILLAFVLVR